MPNFDGTRLPRLLLSIAPALLRRLMVALVSLAVAYTAASQPADLPEEVKMVPVKSGIFTIDLETTIYRPPGAGPFPLVVINHGKALGNPRFQGRSRPTPAARFFLERGYLVVVPMRAGFSKSDGTYVGVGCNIESNGRVQAEDVSGIVAYFSTLPEVDRTRILIVGQSHGGWTTLAYGAENPAAGVRGLINFAGGLRVDSCIDWAGILARGAGAYGKDTRLPSLWLYGDNDSYFPPEVVRPMFERYKAAGTDATLVAYGRFGADSHALFGSATGRAVWEPYVHEFLDRVGLPTTVINSQFAPPIPMTTPPATNFAALDDVEALIFAGESARTGYKQFLEKPLPRAFAVSTDRHWGWASEGDDPLRRALSNCQKNAKATCRLYAVDRSVVWSPE